MRILDISLVQFKNYAQQRFSFGERVTGICGRNGVGKTNLLDAVYYLCFTKSYFGKSDAQHVLHGAHGFRLDGRFELNGQTIELSSILRETGKKEFSYNGEIYTRLSDHIGKLPCVMIAPDDVQIITDGSEERRRVIDALLSQIDHQYLLQLIQYNKVLQQRNSLLKQMAEQRSRDTSLLEVLDDQLVQAGNYVFEQRKKFLQQFMPLVQLFYQKISGEEYLVDIVYDSQLLQEPFLNCLRRFREKDLILQRTNAGIHKDDIDFTLLEKPFKQIASQGQRKSLLFALKLAEFETLRSAKGFPPVLLLDDVFEKLDEKRMYNLLEYVCVKNEGQVLLTDTHCERLENELKKMGAFGMIDLIKG